MNMDRKKERNFERLIASVVKKRGCLLDCADGLALVANEKAVFLGSTVSGRRIGIDTSSIDQLADFIKAQRG